MSQRCDTNLCNSSCPDWDTCLDLPQLTTPKLPRAKKTPRQGRKTKTKAPIIETPSIKQEQNTTQVQSDGCTLKQPKKEGTMKKVLNLTGTNSSYKLPVLSFTSDCASVLINNGKDAVIKTQKGEYTIPSVGKNEYSGKIGDYGVTIRNRAWSAQLIYSAN